MIAWQLGRPPRNHVCADKFANSAEWGAVAHTPLPSIVVLSNIINIFKLTKVFSSPLIQTLRAPPSLGQSEIVCEVANFIQTCH